MRARNRAIGIDRGEAAEEPVGAAIPGEGAVDMAGIAE
jgi:hypothetical protein